MERERWQQLERVCQAALDRADGERAAFLEEACAGDEALRRDAEVLLAHARQAENYLEVSPLADGLREDLARLAAAGAIEPGQVLAQRFQLVRKLGEGGMGQVWLAQQTSPVQRQVALKLIKAGMYDESAVHRFQAERQSLAMMDHPAIAKMFEAGVTEQGQPYFVMEYVSGSPITDYCDQKKLTIKERLELFIETCEGIQHAHQKAIMHRDLKPANILVVEVDGKPLPRIIDFGLAKATTPLREGETLFSRPGNLVGTPAYMSPEQADSNVQDIDTRTDVYSLGVVLYVLLTGTLPIEVKRWQKQPLEVLQKLREEEPARPSAKVSGDRETSVSIAEARATAPAQLLKLLRGDLDWITLKALEKDRARRYGAASEMAVDVWRYLHDEPVMARPASFGYRLRKYTRRNRVTVGVAAGLALLLAGFITVQAVELRRITRERDRANRITDFMTDMFKVSDPSEARGKSVTAREILDKAANDMGAGLAKDPEVQSDMMQVMASTYLNLGLHTRAHELAKRALDARQSLYGPDDPKTLASMSQLGWILEHQGRYAEGEKLLRQALIGEHRVLGPEDALTIETMDHLAVILVDLGHNEEAEKLARDAIEIETRRLGPESAHTLLSMDNLSRALYYQSRYAEAEQEYRRLLDMDRRVLGSDHPQTLAAMDNLAGTLYAEHRMTEAEQLYGESLAARRRVLGPEHQETARTIDNLAALISVEGRLSEGEKLHREALGIRLRTLGPEHPETLISQYNLADVLFREGRVHEAEVLQRETLATQLRVLGPENQQTLVSQSNLAGILTREGHYAEAERIAREAFDVQLRTLGPQDPDTLDTLRQIGDAMAYTHRYPEAAGLFRDTIQKIGKSRGQGNQFEVWYIFACVAAVANRPDDALQYLREAIHRGYKDADFMMADDDLRNLRPNPHFRELLAALKAHSTVVQTQ